MRKILPFLIVLFFSLYSEPAACVGKILNIGIVGSVNDSLLAEMVSVLIIERTGTTVNIKVFDSYRDIYEAVKKDEVGIIIENTGHAMSMMNLPESGSKKNDYDISKKQYKDKFNLTWLMPFGSIPEGKESLYYSPVITEYVLVNFPALPRIINKLKGISEDRNFSKFFEPANSGDRARAAAKDFLKRKKLI